MQMACLRSAFCRFSRLSSGQILARWNTLICVDRSATRPVTACCSVRAGYPESESPHWSPNGGPHQLESQLIHGMVRHEVALKCPTGLIRYMESECGIDHVIAP